jgi:hypothetical protein
MNDKNTILKYGTELIIFPTFSSGPPCKIWFLSHKSGSLTIPLGAGVAFVTDDPEVIRTYGSIQEILSLQSQNVLKYRSIHIIPVDSISHLHLYTEKRLSTLESAYKFLVKAQNFFARSRQLCLLPRMAVLQLGSSSYFYRVRRWPRLIQTRFLLNTLFTLLFGIIKLPLAIIIFLFDVFKIAFLQYAEYRKSLAKYASVQRRQQLIYAFNNPEDEVKINNEVSKAKTELLTTRENYAKHNLTLLTLILSTAAFVVSGFFAIDKINRLTQQISAMNTQIESCTNEVTAKELKIVELSAEVSSLQSVNNIMQTLLLKSTQSQITDDVKVAK